MPKKVIYIIIFFFIQGIIHNLGHPVTPAFVRSLEIDDYMFGVFFSAMSFGLMLGAPILGSLSDQGHKKKIIFFGLLTYSIGQIGFAYVTQPTIMVIFRFISGFGVVGAITTLTSILIESTDISKRAKILAYSAASLTLGASIGYYLGGMISTHVLSFFITGTPNYQFVFFIQAILNVGYALMIILMLDDCKQIEPTQEKPSFLKGFKEIAHIKKSLLVFLISLTFITIGSTNLSKYIDVYFDELGYNPNDLGTFVMVTGIVSLAASILMVPLFAKLKKQLFTIGILHLINAIVVIYVFRAVNFLLTIYTIYMIYVIFKAVFQPLEQSYISLHAKKGNYGTIMGIRQSFFSIGMVLGPLIGGFLYEKKPLYVFDFSALTFLIGIVLLLIVYFFEKNEQKKEVIHDDILD